MPDSSLPDNGTVAVLVVDDSRSVRRYIVDAFD
jgi:hypothetical protein